MLFLGPKMLQNPGLRPGPRWGAYSAPSDPLPDGEGLAARCQDPIPALGPSGLVSTVSGSNPLQSWQPTNDRFQM